MLNIYIDESGSFVPAEYQGAWSLSAALVIPKLKERNCREALRKLKVKSGFKYNEEIKLKDISEDNYLQFLIELSSTACTLYAVATDAGAQNVNEILEHRNEQAEKIEEHKEKMIHADAAESIASIASQVRELSAQLHLQLVCQVELMADVISKSMLFYVQRFPSQLNGFCWRIDEKTGGVSNFERTFRTLVPPFLQTKSLQNPDIHVIDFDYSAMRDFLYTKQNAPTYLEEHYGIKSNLDGALNIGKLVWDDFKFVDSKNEIGVQIVDLLASGVRRVLRGGFIDAVSISKALGCLMLQTIDNGYPIRLITVSNNKSSPNDIVYRSLELFKSTQRQMLKKY